MFSNFNLKKKITLAILLLKVTFIVLALLSLLFFESNGIVFTVMVCVIALFGTLLLHKLSSMIDKLLNKYVSSVIANNTLISSNILDAVLSQGNFVEKNNAAMGEIANYVDKLKIEAYTTKEIVQSVVEKSQKTLMVSSKE